ncbi:MAG: LamB/YcsF family protein [Gemmatimonadaceae bacterium]|jgi:UPF0271 protein|nr:LamB/YcsF family protein [Gemmatimonadaceae bacterium]
MPSIDLNADMGEGVGPWHMGADAELLALVTSANVACGFHAGDPTIMRETARAAHAHGVALGAHPGLPDLVGFGRRELRITPDEAHALVLYQIGALQAMARAAGTRVGHVKPHGALYTMAARDAALSEAIARAVHDADPSLVLVGLADSETTRAGTRVGLRVAHEGFADRRYRADGTLVPRSAPDALLDEVHEAVAQATALATGAPIGTQDGAPRVIRCDTLCLHGDGPHAVAFARAIRTALAAAGVDVAPLVSAPRA